MSRLFLAVDLHEQGIERLEQAVEPLRTLLPEGRFVDRSKRHITLLFVGEADEEEVRSKLAGIRPMCGELSVGELGAFPSRRAARVLWVGVSGDIASLRAISSDARRRIEAIAPNLDTKQLRPHLTVARFRSPIRLPALPEFPPIVCGPTGVTLYASKLSSKGSSYRVVESWPIGAA